MLPLFPLGTVLFPGLVLPLHVFEQRYRDLVHDLQQLPEAERRFGVIAIREGREVGADGISALHAIGCAAQVREIEAHPDGRFDLLTVGTDVFRLDELHDVRSYFTGTVTWLPDDPGDPDEAAQLATSVRREFADYLDALAQASGAEVDVPELPEDPRVLSHLVGATTLLDLSDRQDLLARPDACARLRRELSLLRREGGFLSALTAAPAPELARTPVSPN